MQGDERHYVLFVGCEAEAPHRHSRPRHATLRPQQRLRVAGLRKNTIRAQVQTIGGYSAHADQQGLVNFLNVMRRRPKDIRLVHGEEKAKQALKENLEALH